MPVADRFHESRPVTLAARWKQLDVDFETTSRWSPYAGPDGSAPSASTQMVAHVSMDKPSDVHVFADMLTGYAARLREVAETLRCEGATSGPVKGVAHQFARVVGQVAATATERVYDVLRRLAGANGRLDV